MYLKVFVFQDGLKKKKPYLCPLSGDNEPVSDFQAQRELERTFQKSLYSLSSKTFKIIYEMCMLWCIRNGIFSFMTLFSSQNSKGCGILLWCSSRHPVIPPSDLLLFLHQSNQMLRKLKAHILLLFQDPKWKRQCEAILSLVCTLP